MKNTNVTKADFRLLRLILLDSYSPGGEAIIDLSDGAILTGENGAGKTSLLNMIPAFYGEHPSNCVSGSSSFSEFYLPHSTSYVIFEYMRRDVPCMAVLFGANEASFGYRFIRSAYDLDLFTENGDRSTLIQSKDIKLQLKTAGVPHSDHLSHKDYRSVIQGVVAGGRQKDVVERRALVSEYSFTNSGSQLRHIDKIVTGMFSRKANFDDFLQVIVDYISTDGNAPISINGDREKYEDWPSQFTAYNEVMTHAGLMVEVEALSAKIKAGEGSLSALHAKMILLGRHLAAQQGVAEKEKSNLSVTLGAEQIAANKSLQEMQGAESKADADAKIVEERVAAIDIRSSQYKDADVEMKVARVDAIPAERELLALSKAKKDVLLGESSKIEQAYLAMANDIGAEYLIQGQSLQAKKDWAREQYEPLFAKNRADLLQADEQIQVMAEAGLGVMREAHHKAIEERAQCEAAVANPIANEGLVKDLDRKRGEMESLQAGIRESQLAKEKLQSQHVAATNEFAKQDSGLLNLRGQVAGVEKDIQQLLSHLSPDETSMLFFLRENKPEWTENIAKVIREDVLVLPGLHPSIEGGDSLYGIQIDLSRLESSLCANEDALQKKLGELHTEAAALQAKVVDAELALSKCNDVRIAADNAVRQHDAGTAVLHAKEKTLKTDLLAAEQAVVLSRKEAKNESLAKLIEAKAAVSGCEQHIKGAQQSLLSAKKSYAEKHAGIEASILKDRDAAVAEVQVEIGRADAAKTTKLEQIAADKNKALSESGVDMAMKKRMDEEIDACAKRIRDAEIWMKEVSDWRFWRDGEFRKRDSLVFDAMGLRANQVKLGEEKKLATNRWLDRQKELQTAITNAGEMIDDLARGGQQIQTNVARLVAYPPDHQVMTSFFDTSWTIHNLMGQVMTLEQERKGFKLEMDGRIRKIKTAFASAHGTTIEQFFLQTRSDVDPDDSNLMAWVAPMQGWFSRGHEDLRTTLMLYADTYGSLVTDFYGKLVKFHGEVLNFNKAIQDALNQTSHFRRVSNITIHFESRLDKLKYWEDVKSFAEAYKQWGYSATRGMPSPEFADCLKRLVGHWETKEGIRAEPHKLIGIRGEVVENGNLKSFHSKVDLEKLSSNGLSYLILCSIFVAFLSKIRGDADVQITWAVDELLDLDLRNVHDLLSMLKDNGIVLFSACPDANLDILQQFSKRYRIQRVNNLPELAECIIDMGDDDV